MKTFLTTMALVAIVTILCIQPVFAQFDDGESTPAVPELGESWDVGPGSRSDTALGPAPEEPMDSEPAPMSGGYTPVHPVTPAEPWMEPPESRFYQPFSSPAFPAAGQMRELPPIGVPHGGFYRPVR